MIEYVDGDATILLRPYDGAIVIAHVCNNLGAWGAGFTKSLSERWPTAEEHYRRQQLLILGRNHFVRVGVGPQYVCSMIAQDGLGVDRRRLSYDALATCLKSLAESTAEVGAEVQMPRIGAGLAGGEWSIIETMIEHHLKDIRVTVFNWKG